MVVVVLAMILLLAVALYVVAMVAVPARREGRDLLTERGEQLVAKVPGLDVLADQAHRVVERPDVRPSDREHASAA